MIDAAHRVDPETLECREGFKACSAVTDAERTICIPEDKSLETDCPITSIYLFTDEQITFLEE